MRKSQPQLTAAPTKYPMALCSLHYRWPWHFNVLSTSYTYIPRRKGKSIDGLAPKYLTNKFTQRSDVNPYNLRDLENKLAIPLPRTNYFKNSFSYSGATLWNSLPSEARQASSLTNFRRVLSNLDTAFMETRL